MRSPLALDGQDVLMAALTDGADAKAVDVEIMRPQLAAASAAGGELPIEVDVGGIAVLGEDGDRLISGRCLRQEKE
jgi:hypothetical protein